MDGDTWTILDIGFAKIPQRRSSVFCMAHEQRQSDTESVRHCFLRISQVV
jgi:hypothetical protein